VGAFAQVVAAARANAAKSVQDKFNHYIPLFSEQFLLREHIVQRLLWMLWAGVGGIAGCLGLLAAMPFIPDALMWRVAVIVVAFVLLFVFCWGLVRLMKGAFHEPSSAQGPLVYCVRLQHDTSKEDLIEKMDWSESEATRGLPVRLNNIVDGLQRYAKERAPDGPLVVVHGPQCDGNHEPCKPHGDAELNLLKEMDSHYKAKLNLWLGLPTHG
jgi:hypothetical protein